MRKFFVIFVIVFIYLTTNAQNQTLINELRNNYKVPKTFDYSTAAEFGTVKVNGKSYDYFLVDLNKYQIKFFWKNGTTPFYNFATLSAHLKKQNLKIKMITNGGIYTKNLTPLGLYIEKHKTLNKLNLGEGSGNFYLKPNGVFYLTDDNQAFITNSKNFDINNKHISYAIQSGPLLVENGIFNKNFSRCSKHAYIRSGVGIVDNKKVLFLISKTPVSFFQLAETFRYFFGCKNALYLDGAISKMYVPNFRNADINEKIRFATFISVLEK